MATETPSVPRFSLVRKRQPVELVRSDGEVEKFTVRELDGVGRDTFLGFMAGKMTFGPDGKPQGKPDIEGMHALLISLCLHNDRDERPNFDTIQTWPSSTQAELFVMAQQISGLSLTERLMPPPATATTNGHAGASPKNGLPPEAPSPAPSPTP